MPKVVLPKNTQRFESIDKLHSQIAKDMLFSPEETSRLILDVISEQMKHEDEPKVPFISELLDRTVQERLHVDNLNFKTSKLISRDLPRYLKFEKPRRYV